MELYRFVQGRQVSSAHRSVDKLYVAEIMLGIISDHPGRGPDTEP